MPPSTLSSAPATKLLSSEAKNNVRSTTADHVLPISAAPHLRMVRSNLRGACASCNYVRQDTPVSELPALRAALAEKRSAPKQSPETTPAQRQQQRAARHIVQQRKPAPALAFFNP